LKVDSLSPFSTIQQEQLHPRKGSDSPTRFEDVLKSFVEEVNNLQKEAGESIKGLVTGEIRDLHQVMIAVEKASTSFELMMEIRNKILEAYREIMRMQV